DGRVLLGATDGRLLSLAADASDVRVLDPSAGTSVRFARQFGDLVVYASGSDSGLALRVARMAGGRAQQLFPPEFTIPVPTAVAGGRVVFHTSYAGQLEGGQVMSVRTDGSELSRLGRDIDGGDGQLHPSAAADQDFEAVTPSGRLIMEMEYEGQTFGQQL